VRPMDGRACTLDFHGLYLELVEQIEQRFPVTEWRLGDVDLWPLARMDLYLEMLRQHTAETAPRRSPLPLRLAGSLAVPAQNLWKSRGDLGHWVAGPRPAHAVILGDGASLDWTGAAWRDRFGEPVIQAFERRGQNVFLMQGGALRRLPWLRPTYAANQLAVRGALGARFDRAEAALPGQPGVVEFLQAHGVSARALAPEGLTHRGRLVGATASAFEDVLRRVQPRLAFVVAWYAGLGPAFVLACRRQGILAVDLQHGPQGPGHKAYRWWAQPTGGYGVMPQAFWSWSEADAAQVRGWGGEGVHGGHPQLAPFLDDDDETTRIWDAAFDSLAGRPFDREILVALQPLPGQQAIWNSLAERIAASPPCWRWWIRRHPAALPDQDAVFGRLLALAGPNVVIDAANALPLPALLRRMSAVVSLASGAASEGAVFGVPALFLSRLAAAMFPDQIAGGLADIVDPADVVARIASLPPHPLRPDVAPAPPLDATLDRLEAMAGS